MRFENEFLQIISLLQVKIWTCNICSDNAEAPLQTLLTTPHPKFLPSHFSDLQETGPLSQVGGYQK